MRTLFVGDVHGCAAALAALLRRARPERVVLLGDLFAKGPAPGEVWAILRDVGAEAVLGNHDQKVLRVWGQDGTSAHHQAARVLGDDARAWLEGRPLFLHGDGWTAVHAGVHPVLGAPGTTREMALVLRRWPDDTRPGNPFWWELYQGEPRVLYGHDALRGLQDHPHSLGLDTGCVYGGPLSGWVLETGELVQVAGGA